jgi:hypothetical protein
MLLVVAAFLPALFLSAVDAYSCDCPFFGVKWTTAPLVVDNDGVVVKYYWDVTVQEDGEVSSDIVYKIDSPQGHFQCNFNFNGAHFTDASYEDCEFQGNGFDGGACVTGTGDCGSFASCGLFGSYLYVLSFNAGSFYFSDNCKCLQVGPVTASPFYLYTRDGYSPDQCNFGDLDTLPVLWFASVYYVILAESFTDADLVAFLDYIAEAIQYSRDYIQGAIITNNNNRRDAQNFTVTAFFYAKSTATANEKAQEAFDLDTAGYPYDVQDKTIVKNNTVTYQSPASPLSLPSVFVSVMAIIVPFVWWNNM